MELRDKLKLRQGEKLVQKSHRSKGPWAETDIWEYAIIDINGNEIGSVTHTDHTAMRGFERTQTAQQSYKGQNGMVVNETW